MFIYILIYSYILTFCIFGLFSIFSIFYIFQQKIEFTKARKIFFAITPGAPTNAQWRKSDARDVRHKKEDLRGAHKEEVSGASSKT